MKRFFVIILFALLVIALGVFMFTRYKKQKTTPITPTAGEIIKLPAPSQDSATSLEEALLYRRSVREYSDEPLTLLEISQLLWAAQGITSPPGYRTAPSAGALYPLEVYILSGNVEDLPAGVYKYRPLTHDLVKVASGDMRNEMSDAALSQDSVKEAAAVIVITGIFKRTTVKYGDRGIQYVHMEVGSVAQNVYLQAESLQLGTVFIGAFYDDEVKRILNLESEEQPLCLMPVGRR